MSTPDQTSVLNNYLTPVRSSTFMVTAGLLGGILSCITICSIGYCLQQLISKNEENLHTGSSLKWYVGPGDPRKDSTISVEEIRPTLGLWFWWASTSFPKCESTGQRILPFTTSQSQTASQVINLKRSHATCTLLTTTLPAWIPRD